MTAWTRRAVAMLTDFSASEAARKEAGMLVEDRYTRCVAERVKLPPLTSGDTLYWDGMGAASQGMGLAPALEPVAHAAWLAPPPTIDSRAGPVVPTWSLDLLFSPAAPVVDWAKEASDLSLYLHPCLLLAPVHDRLPGATGLAPHQYVLRCRMEHAKRLLAETDLSLMDIVHQVGCADHSHFTALFRKHVTMTPKAYRNHTRSQCV